MSIAGNVSPNDANAQNLPARWGIGNTPTMWSTNRLRVLEFLQLPLAVFNLAGCRIGSSLRRIGPGLRGVGLAARSFGVPAESFGFALRLCRGPLCVA